MIAMQRIGRPALLVLALLGGCRQSSSLTGQWKYQAPNVGSTSGFSAGKQGAIQAGQQMMASWALDLRPDNTFTLTTIQPITGSWSVNQSTITLNAEKVEAGVSGPAQVWKKAMIATLSGEGHTIKIEQGSPLGIPLTFAKP